MRDPDLNKSIFTCVSVCECYHHMPAHMKQAESCVRVLLFIYFITRIINLSP